MTDITMTRSNGSPAGTLRIVMTFDVTAVEHGSGKKEKGG